MTHPKKLLPDYALGLLDPDEMAAVEAHLETCEACQEEVRHFDATLVGWVDALSEVEPPPRAKADLFNRIRDKSATSTPVIKNVDAEPQNGSLSAEDTDLGADTDAETDTETSIETNTEAEPTNIIRYRAPRAVRWLAAACAACLVLAGGGLFQALRADLALEQLRAEQALVTRFLSAPNARTATLYNDADQEVGAALLRPGEALFVLAEPPPERRVYQAWGHTSDDWSPQSGEQLTSLTVSQNSIFDVSTEGFASLYVSLEPPGGSPQPTDPLSRVPLSSPTAQSVIAAVNPADGAILTVNSTIVRGTVGDDVRELRYRLGGGPLTDAPLSGDRFTFTLSELQLGENRLELRAVTASGETSSEVLTLRFVPE